MLLRKALALLAASTFAASCSTNKEPPPPPSTPVVAEVISHVDENAVPGTVTQPWEEEMHNQVKVPGQLDPTGTYYRPPHQTIVEIRPGRFQPVQYPNTDDKAQR